MFLFDIRSLGHTKSMNQRSIEAIFGGLTRMPCHSSLDEPCGDGDRPSLLSGGPSTISRPIKHLERIVFWL
jgi:hypothetical protein